MSSGTVCIIGAGTMGAGIAQVAATAGWTVRLSDVDEPTVARAIDGIRARYDRLIEKGTMTAAARDADMARLRPAARGAEAYRGCDLVLEAVVEKLDTKLSVLRPAVAAAPPEAIIATNTSSLSVGALGEALGAARRTVGMHFFNPAPLMKLVEVIAAKATDPAVADRTAQIAASWGKIVARSADVPGFIVNHVARPYYLEAFRILEEGHAGPETIDRAMRDLGGFRMGPLELTDLIGQEVNTATTRQVWEALGRPPLLRPSMLQESLVAQGRLGRKTGRGVYDYSGDAPLPAIEVTKRHGASAAVPSPALLDAVERFAGGRSVEHLIFARILIALVVQAQQAEKRGVASRADIDTALKYGVNYPRGPFEWADRIGRDNCTRLLSALAATTLRFEPTGAESREPI